MSFQLQQFQYDGSAYHRPNLRWVCGRARDGNACQAGPDPRGRCRGGFECQPGKEGDRWACTRTRAGRPARCEDGPRPDGTCGCPVPPCRPERSVRGKRGVVVGATVALTVGVLALFATGPRRARFLSPGPLSMNHAQLDSSCGKCHRAGDLRLGSVLPAALSPAGTEAANAQCLRCHAAFGPTASQPHGLAPDALETREQAAAGDGPAAGLRRSLARWLHAPPPAAGPVACATCHVEHRGRRVDLTHLDPVRCQSCHRQPFASLADGHPEFSPRYPAAQRTPIAFNHARHITLHFPTRQWTRQWTGTCLDPPVDRHLSGTRQWTGTCLSCHEPDPTGARMLVKGFETTCGSCHQHRNQIRAAAPVAFFNLPAFDLAALREGGVSIGEGEEPWPVDAGEGDEYALSPFMKLLLIAADEQGTVAEDLQRFRDPSRLWDLAGADEADLAAAGRLLWAVKDLLYRLLTGGGAALEQLLAATLGDLSRSELDALAGSPADAPRAEAQDFAAVLQALGAEAGLGLAGLEKDLARHRGEEAAEEADESLDLFGDEDEEGGDLDLFGQEEEDSGTPAAGEDSSRAAVFEALGGASGWVLQPDRFAVAYRPAGHADPFLTSWLNRTADPSGLPAAEFAAQIFDALGRDLRAGETAATMRPRNAAGRCVRCHSVDTLQPGDRPRYRVNWTAARPRLGERRFTRFDHRPHFNFDRFQDCLACHAVTAIDEQSFLAWKATYQNGNARNPDQYVSGFGPIARTNCTTCHTPTGAGDGCLSCHNYHVGTFKPLLSPPGIGQALFSHPRPPL